MCVVCNSIQWIYRHNPNLHLLHMSPYISLHLFVCLLACFLILHILVICTLFACLLCLFAQFGACVFVLHMVDGACALLLRSKQMGHRLVYFRGLTLREVHYFLRLFFRTMYSRFPILGFSSYTLLWVTPSGGYVYILALFVRCKYYACLIM